MSDHDQIYGRTREAQLIVLLRHLAHRIEELDQAGKLLDAAPELQRLLGDARSELFHYEVRLTYETPELAESRRIVEEARRSTFEPTDPGNGEPWRPNPSGD